MGWDADVWMGQIGMILEGMEMQMGRHVDGMGKNQSKVGHDACDAFFTLKIVHVGIKGMS